MSSMTHDPISVVIPYYNEVATIERTLGMLKNQTLPPYEVLMIDSGSTDGCHEAIHRWIERNRSSTPVRFQNVRAMTSVPSSSKNAGIRLASCELIAFMDCGLIFPSNWLESQLRALETRGTEIVHATGRFRGDDSLDRAAIAQTYGYARARACVPGSLMRKSLFSKVGIFLEGLRAGYDADWLRQLDRVGVARYLNPEVEIDYMGKSYTSSFTHLLRKTITYSAPTVGLQGYYFPYIYCFAPIPLLALAFFFPALLFLFVAAYFLGRGFVIPYRKAGGANLFREIPLAAFYLPAVGLTMDLGKFLGYWKGLIRGRK